MIANASGVQLWAALRGLTDTELDRIQTIIRLYHCTNAFMLQSHSLPSTSDTNQAIPLKLGDKTQLWRVETFVHVFLDYLHRQVELHAQSQVSDVIQPSIAPTTSSRNATFEDEFPLLRPVETKPIKRRITTTLLPSNKATETDRLLPATIAFSSLNTCNDTSSAWSKHSLLEKRLNATPCIATSSDDTPVWGSNCLALGATNSITPKQQEHTGGKGEINKKMALSRRQQLSRQGNATRDQASPHSQRGSQEKTIALKQEPNVAASTTINKPTTSQSEAELGTLSSAFCVNKPAAKLYGFLLRERYVKTTCVELQVLVSLLYRADCSSCTPSTGQSEITRDCSHQAARSEFCWRIHCLAFASIVFNEIESLLKHLSVDLLQRFKACLNEGENNCSDLVKRLEQEAHRREELRVSESARLGYHLPVEMKASAVRDFALPFNEEMDSRLHYRTAREAILYTNREKARDQLLHLVRTFQEQLQSVVGFNNKALAAATTAARALLRNVSLENRWWFAKFFVQELVQIGANPFGENDNDLVVKILQDKLVGQNPDRLRKLHRRFSSQNATPQTSPRSVHLTSKARGKGTHGLRQARHEKLDDDDGMQEDMSTLHRLKRLFTNNQLFFAHFLHTCDSYAFSELVKRHLEREFDTMHACLSDRKAFTEIVLKLKVVAKFLGYLCFSPQWPVTSAIRQLSMENVALQAVEQEGIHTFETRRTLDVKKLVEASIRHGKMAKCMPWLCDYLTMLSLDTFSLQTRYFKQLVVLLYLLYRSDRLTGLGETGLYIAIQLERIFNVLHVDGNVLQRREFQREDLAPSREIVEMLQQKQGAASQETTKDEEEDAMPFLYSQVFVQTCVSELEDLRGFLQTRAQWTRQKVSMNSGRTGSHCATPLRKLRPLQIVNEGDARASFTIPSESFDSQVLPTLETISSELDQATDTLSNAVFKLYPRLKSIVDFVVATVTTDICEHVLKVIVTTRADALVHQSSKESNFTREMTKGIALTSQDTTASAARASFQKLLTSKIRDEANNAARTALDTALQLGQERVRAALPAFLPPLAHPTFIQSIVHVAMQRTRGALEMLVPKTAQMEFGTRVAFWKKKMVKDTVTVSTDSVRTTLTSSCTRMNVQKELRRVSALLSKKVDGYDFQGNGAKWQAQVKVLLQDVLQFSVVLDTCGAMARQASSLVLWDVIWRAVTSCLQFFEASLDNVAEYLLFLSKHERVNSIESDLEELVTGFVSLFQAVVRLNDQADGDHAAFGRVQSLFIFVLDYVTKWPSKRLDNENKGLLAEQSAVWISSLIVSNLRVVILAADEQCRIDVNWKEYRTFLHSEKAHKEWRRCMIATQVATTAM